MKNTIKGFIFWTIALTFIFVIFTVAEALSKVITMSMIMNLVYVLLVISVVYILKNV